MKSIRQATKPFWAMSKTELAEATKEFDREGVAGFKPLSKKQRARWERIRREKSDGCVVNGHSPVRLQSAGDVKLLREKIRLAATGLAKRLKKMANHPPFDLLRDFKLKRLGYDPYDPDMEMNLVEQINQSATLLVACAAVVRLLKKHPSRAGYVVSRPTAKGYDVWAEDASVAAEVFAATSPGSSRKITKVLDRLVDSCRAPFASDLPPRHRYVFFVSETLNGFPPKAYPLRPGSDPILGDVWQLDEPGRCPVTVVPLSEAEVFG